MTREYVPVNPSCLGTRSRFGFHENRALVWLTSLSSAPTPSAEHRGVPVVASTSPRKAK